MRQMLVYFHHQAQLGVSTPPVEIPGVSKRPSRLWTMVHARDPDKSPALPVTPRHHHNAFLEDYIHDWNWRVKDDVALLKYYSRASDGRVWLLLEYDE